MAASNIISKYHDGKLWQVGSGVPEHDAPLYTVFTDTSTGKEYIALTTDGTWGLNSQLINFDDVNKTYQFATGLSTQKIQIGQEQWMLMYSTTAIAEGVPVVLGSWNNTYKCFECTSARADTELLADVLGVTTTSTTGAGLVGVTIDGKINKINTTGYAANAILYLAPTGGLTNIKPSAPNKVRVIGKVGNSAAEGTLYVGKFWNRVDYEQIMQDTGEPNGFTKTEKAKVTLSYNPSTRVVTVSGTFYFYNQSLIYTKTAVTETVTHTNSSGVHYIYYVGSTLTVSSTSWDLSIHTPVTLVVFNNEAATTFWLGQDGFMLCERHGTVMDHETHKSMHQTIGCYAPNSDEFALSGTYSVATGTGGLAANTFGIATGTVRDEDNETSLNALSDNAGVGNNYMCYYKAGTSWRWFYTNLPYLINNGNMLYNDFTTTPTLTEVTANDVYVNVYVFGQPTTSASSNYRFGFVTGQAIHLSPAAAAAETIYNLNLTGLAGPEIAWLHKITYRRSNSYSSAAGTVRIEAVSKLVGSKYVSGSVSGGGGGGGTTDHTLLINRDAANQHPASSILVTLDGATTMALSDYLSTAGHYGQGTYGETISVGDNLYLGSDQKLYKANATVIGTMTVIGKATQAGVLNDVKSYLIRGIYTYGSAHSLTPVGSGSRMFASTTAGLTTMSAPSSTGNIVQVLGHVLNTTQVYFAPAMDYYEIG